MTIFILLAFVLGYAAIAFEQNIRINKAATALVTGVVCWVLIAIDSTEHEQTVSSLLHHLGEIAQVLFFLLGAMTIVELIDAHDGFEIITQKITTRNKGKMLVIIAILSFFLSAVLDNLTTAIVMISLVRKLVPDKMDRWKIGGMIIIAANAGGAWSPIGDVTTTMLWIGKQITALNIILKLIIPSLVCVLIPLFILRAQMKGDMSPVPITPAKNDDHPANRNIILFSGITILLLVPVFKTITHLPPFMGMMAGLGILWMITERIHSGKDDSDRENYSVGYALQKIDSPSILFFLGILLAVSALQIAGILGNMSVWMTGNIKNDNIVIMSFGVLSSVVDNVPLVAAVQGMYDLQTYPTDHYFWEFLAYATGTGGSLLIIGSAAGIAVMGIEKISFGWYLRKIAWVALLGFLCGAAAFIAME